MNTKVESYAENQPGSKIELVPNFTRQIIESIGMELGLQAAAFKTKHIPIPKNISDLLKAMSMKENELFNTIVKLCIDSLKDKVDSKNISEFLKTANLIFADIVKIKNKTFSVHDCIDVADIVIFIILELTSKDSASMQTLIPSVTSLVKAGLNKSSWSCCC